MHANVGTPSERETISSDAQAEFARLYAEVRPRVHRYLARRVGESDAEDLTQIVFLKASQALPGFRGAAALSTWLARIADHTVKIRLHRARSMLQKALEARCTLSRDARHGLACDVKPSA